MQRISRYDAPDARVRVVATRCGGHARDVKVDLPEAAVQGLAVGRDGRLVTVSGRTLRITKNLAMLGPGDVFSMTAARNGSILAVMGNGAGIGPVPRVVNGSVTLLPGISMCLPDQPCADYFENPVWVE